VNTEKSLCCSNRCWDIVIFNLLGCRPPASWISLDLCNGPNSHEGRTASLCQISSKSVNRGRDMAIFQFFKMAATATLDFWHLKFLTVGTPKRVELYHRTIFRRNRANRGWDMAILRFSRWRRPPSWICKILNFLRSGRSRGSKCIILPYFVNIGWTTAEIWRFFKMAAAAILDFWNFKFLTVGTVKRVKLHHHAKFRRNRSSGRWDMTIFRFLRWRPKYVLVMKASTSGTGVSQSLSSSLTFPLYHHAGSPLPLLKIVVKWSL